ncbi:MAG TPA: tetratricopeptide repeat protein, partial [Afifellaceae bacterium]|nr:tetratricopeptide repeat protein [Afifellaceae bacterium]
MSVFALVVAAIVGASSGPGEPSEEKWRRCIDGADEARIAGCEEIVGDTDFTRNARAFAAATIGDIYLAQLRPAAAAGEFSRAIRLAPDYGYPYRRRGFAFFLTGRSDEALADYDSAIELSPLDPYAHVSRGSFFRQIGELDRARADIEKALELDLENSDLYYERGLLSLDVRDYQQAELDFTKSLLLKPDEHDARYNLVNALRFQLRTE